ncbi:unnamed protein product [Linum tenue]|uniref:Aminotransferase-like plant mobile domain-containing protein n=1 Tax=Linum tenue TaxID=586396 RepID=A0AAV0IMR4_9ROSI|nr:unnamed protein product [Linum tenue]
MMQHLDMALLSAFVERWQPDTNTFHMPFGEISILLHDVHHILRIPVDGELSTCRLERFPSFYTMCITFFGYRLTES